MTRLAGCLAGLAAMVLTAGAVQAQTLGRGVEADIPWGRALAAFLICLALAVFAVFMVHRRATGQGADLKAIMANLRQALNGFAGAEKPEPRLALVETRRVSPHVTVAVFRCDGRDFLLASSMQGGMALMRLEDVAGPESE